MSTLCGLVLGASGNPGRPFGDHVASLSPEITEILAGLHMPDHEGALGRNRQGYIHVRFQMGVHHLASHALTAKDQRALEQFVCALEYAFAHQTAQGEFPFQLSGTLKKRYSPSETDRASGTLFFIASAASGLYAIKTSTWAQQAPTLRPLLARLTSLESKLPATLEYLLRQRARVERADQHAPNRLLINALAFIALGKILNSTQAMEAGHRFVDLAVAQVHPDGYFIEGGGYDSSYNGVATATALRLALLDPSLTQLKRHAEASMAWHVTRITAEGEIRTDGNTRVHSSGESFLGKQKTVDVPHTLEALIWSSLCKGSAEPVSLAQRIYAYYRSSADKR